MTTSPPSRSRRESDLAPVRRCTSRRWSGGSRRSARAASGRRRPTGIRSRETDSSWRRSSTSGRTASTACSRTGTTSTFSFRSWILPRVMRETSSRSSISRARCRTAARRPPGAIPGSSDVAPLRDLDGVGDGRERVPQLVGEHGQELVLAAVILLERLLRPLLVVDVGAGPEPFGDRPVVVADRRASRLEPSGRARLPLIRYSRS